MSNPTIPVSHFVNVTPGVVAPAGNGVDLNGMFLTTSVRVPIGSVYSFADAASVGAFFGLSSAEYAAALVYFAGFDNSNKKPGLVLFYQYNTAAVGAYVNGGNISGLTLTQLQALTPGTVIVTIDGTPHTSSTINLAATTSFSDAASIIQTALSASPATVTYDSVSGGFIIHSGTTGATSTIGPVTGTAAAELLLTAATGAYSSQGADVVASPSAAMTSVVAITQNWATFTTLFNPDNSGDANKLLFATWTATQNNRFAYVGWYTDATPTTNPAASTSFTYIVTKTAQDSGVIPVYDPSGGNYAAAMMGMIASIDFTETAGRTNIGYRTQSGLVPTVTSSTAATNLEANGSNYYGATATAQQNFNFFYPGSIAGPFKWIDAYVDQIWLNAQFQVDLITLLTQVKSIPYNAAGYTLVEAALMSTIGQAVDFGAIQPGVTLSGAQVAEVNAAAGANIAGTLSTRGWYLQIKDAPATVRVARGSPSCTFWYVDGGSINKINLASIDVQ